MTNLVKRNPWRELEDLQRDMWERLLSSAYGESDDGGIQMLAVDAYTTDDAIVVKASVPGINPDDLHIDVENDVLTIRGEYSHEHNETDKHYVLRERRMGRFERRLRLDTPVNLEAAEAVFKNGELTLTLPKAEEAKALTIPVKRLAS